MGLSEAVLNGIVGYATGGPPGAIAGGVSGLASNSGGSSAKNVEAKSISGRDEDQEKFWSDFMYQIYGYDPSIETDKFLKDNPELAKDIQARVASEIGGGVPFGLREFGHSAMTKANRAALDMTETEELIKQYAQEAYEADPEKYGMPPIQKTLQDKLKEDSDFQRQSGIDALSGMFGANTEFLTQNAESNKAQDAVDLLNQTNMGNLGNDLITSRQGETSDFVGGSKGLLDSALNPLLKSLVPLATRDPISLKLGNFETPFTSGTQRRAISDVGTTSDRISGLNKGIFGAKTDLSDLIFGTRGDQSALEQKTSTDAIDRGRGQDQTALGMKTSFLDAVNNLNQQFTPNRSEKQYLDFLTMLNQQQDALRTGSPTTTSTGQLNEPFNLLGQAGDTVRLVEALNKLMGNGGGNTNPVTTTPVTTTQDLDNTFSRIV